MKSTHTFRSIADEMSREKRTVQGWYARACAEVSSEIGTLIDGTRYFTDEERAALIKHAGADRPSKTPPPSPLKVEVESGNHQIILTQPELLQTYTLEGLRKSESVGFEDPLALAAQFLQVADQLVDSMQSDIDQREQRLNQTRQAKAAITAKASELKLEARFYTERTRAIDTALSTETQNLQEALATLQQLGKPQEVANG